MSSMYNFEPVLHLKLSEVVTNILCILLKFSSRNSL